jgi:hypothetical protein
MLFIPYHILCQISKSVNFAEKRSQTDSEIDKGMSR